MGSWASAFCARPPQQVPHHMLPRLLRPTALHHSVLAPCCCRLAHGAMAHVYHHKYNQLTSMWRACLYRVDDGSVQAASRSVNLELRGGNTAEVLVLELLSTARSCKHVVIASCDPSVPAAAAAAAAAAAHHRTPPPPYSTGAHVYYHTPCNLLLQAPVITC